MTPQDVTVAVATYGRPEALERCLGAIGRGGAPGELLVVDQAPSDAARRIATAAGARYLTQEPRGLSASRNLALREAARPVLAVTDDDCQPERAWLDAIASVLTERAPYAAVAGAVLPPPGPAPPGFQAVSTRGSQTPADHRGRELPWRVGSGGNFAARAALLRGAGGWDERLGAGTRGRAGEDLELVYRLLRGGAFIRYEPRAVVRHAWQPSERRWETRWTYGFGVGAMAGVLARRRDPYAAVVTGSYAAMQGRRLAGALRRRDRVATREQLRTLAAIGPGLWYGLTARPR